MSGEGFISKNNVIIIGIIIMLLVTLALFAITGYIASAGEREAYLEKSAVAGLALTGARKKGMSTIMLIVLLAVTVLLLLGILWMVWGSANLSKFGSEIFAKVKIW